MRKIKKIINVIPSLDLGGAEIMVENLSYELIKCGYDTSVISLYDKNTDISNRLLKNNISVYNLNKSKGFDYRVIYKLYKLFKNIKPDVVHSHLYALPYTMIAAQLAMIPVKIHTVHSIASKEVSKNKRRMSKLFFKCFNVIPVSISPQVKVTIMEEYGLSAIKVPLVYNGIDLNKCMRKVDYKINEESINIIHVGNFKEAKNHVGLIKSFKLICDKYPNAKLSLIGVGELQSNIRSQVIRLGLEKNVLFEGAKENVYKHLHDADIFVLPSLWEGMPISLIEAMATGLPIVTTAVGGIIDMVENKTNAMLVDADDNQIANAIIELIRSESLRTKIGNCAIVTANNFSAKIMCDDYIRLYECRWTSGKYKK